MIEKPTRYVISNHQNMPVELHLSAGVIVVDARGLSEIQEGDLENPQLQVLRRHRLIDIRRVEERPPASPLEKSSPAAATEKPVPASTLQTGRRGKTKAEA